MFFITTPDGNSITGDSQLVQDARDQGKDTFTVDAHGHQYGITIHDSSDLYGLGGTRLTISTVDGVPVNPDDIGKPIPDDKGGDLATVGNVTRHGPGGRVVVQR